MKMVKKTVSELEGAQLDWAVMLALGYHRYSGPWWSKSGAEMLHEDRFAPSSDWNCGGPIIERERIHVIPAEGIDWLGWASFVDGLGIDYVQYGDTPLIAAMRAFVASKLGDEVEVPE